MSSSSDSSETDYDDSYDYNDYDDDDGGDVTTWSKLKDGWQEFLPDETAFFVIEDESKKQTESSQIEDNRDRFYDPLGILKIPPRKAMSIKSHLISLESESFSPVVYLSEIHAQTKFTELSVGMSKLKEALSSKALEIKFLVKENFEHFVKCKDTVDEVYDLISKSKMLEDMTGSFIKIIDNSSNVYHPLLRGKQEADHIRRVLTLLNKYKVIFKLPGKISENIRQGEFEKVVHNYKNAKTLITTNNKKPFQKILLDIERIIEDFRGQMYSFLKDPQTKPDQLKKYIKVLMEIGNGKGDWMTIGDPCWYCLTNKHKAISLLIKQCHDEVSLPNHKRIRKLSILLLSNIPNFYKLGRSYVEGKFEDSGKDQSKSYLQARPTDHLYKGKTKENKTVTVIVYYLDETFSSYRVDQDKRIKDLVEMCKKRFIDEDSEYCLYKLTEKKSSSKESIPIVKLVELAPDESPYKLQKKWGEKSGKSNHKFLFKRRGEEFIKNDGSHIIQKDLNSSYKSHKKQYSAATSAINEENLKKLIIELLQLYSSKVEDLFFDEDFLNDDLNSSQDGDQPTDSTTNMVENVNEVIKCQEMLHGLGMPSTYLSSIDKLAESLTLHFVNQVCSEMVAEVSFLYLLEDWSTNDDSQSVIISGNQVDGMTTTKLLGEFVNTIKTNLDKLSFIANKPNLLPHVEMALCEAIESFGDCLHHLVFSPTPILNTDGTSGPILNPSQKLLLTLSNCSTVVSKIAVQLRGYYVQVFHQSVTGKMKKVIEKLGVLERLILDKYVQEKNNMLGEFIAKGILYSGNVWMDSTPPVSVNSYVMTILTKLVFIHNEVMKTINSFEITCAIISRIYEYLLVTFQYNFNQLDSTFISPNGILQFLLDVQMLENILDSSFGNEKTAKLSSSIRKNLTNLYNLNNNKTKQPFNLSANNKQLEPVLQGHLNKTSLLFSCFKSH
eukprot:gene389-490_t